MQKDKTQLLRLIFVDQKIREGMRTGKYANCANIGREYEVSQKSIQRDMDYLKNQRDAPIEYDSTKRGYYYTEENYSLPAMDISASDLFAISIAEKVLRQHEHTPIYQKLTSVFKKIEESMPEKVSIHPSWINTGISIIGGHRTVIKPEVWATIANALENSKLLHISYNKPGSESPSKRNIEPYHIVSFQGEWYMIGFCHLRKEILTFAISRISRAKLKSESFSVPSDFDYSKISKQKFGIFSGSDSIKIEILFNKQTAPYVTEREWHASQNLVKKNNGELLMTISVSHLFEIKKWILSWGSSVKVLKPKVLRDEIKEELEKTFNQY